MLRKKIIALGLVGMTTFGTIASNAAIVIASPTNAEASHNMMPEGVFCGMTQHGLVTIGLQRLEKSINEGNYEDAINYYKEYNNYIEVIKQRGQYKEAMEDFLFRTGLNATDFQNKFDELSKQIDLLKPKQTFCGMTRYGMVTIGISRMEKLINEGNYENAINWQKEFKIYLEFLNERGEYKAAMKELLARTGLDATDFQNKFDELTRQINLLKPESN